MKNVHGSAKISLSAILKASWWLPTFVLLVLCFHKDNNYRTLNCLVIDNLASAWLPYARLFHCSNVRQQIDYEASSNLTSADGDVAGWKVLKAADASSPAVLVVTLTKDRDSLVFFPRLKGRENAVEVYEVYGSGVWHRIALADSPSKEWSEIGRQCRIDLCCVEHGELEKEFDLKLHFVLKGPWAQLWMKDDAVVF